MKFTSDLIHLLDAFPKSWAQRRHTIEWIEQGPRLHIWTSNGGWFCTPYDCNYPSLPVWDRWRLWLAIKRWRSKHHRFAPLPSPATPGDIEQ